jgi:hypothetical protein
MAKDFRQYVRVGLPLPSTDYQTARVALGI